VPIPTFGYGRWWTVLSAGWLHGSLLHILFNMYWVRILAPATADLYGPGRMVIIYTAASVGGFALSSLAYMFLPHLPFLTGGQFTVGASAPVFGLLGALVYYGRRGSSAVGQQALQYALFLGIFGLVLGMAGGGIDNYAHLGGFGAGYVAALVLNPLRRNRSITSRLRSSASRCRCSRSSCRSCTDCPSCSNLEGMLSLRTDRVA
jgi:rhomboid protease GluP